MSSVHTLPLSTSTSAFFVPHPKHRANHPDRSGVAGWIGAAGGCARTESLNSDADKGFSDPISDRSSVRLAPCSPAPISMPIGDVLIGDGSPAKAATPISLRGSLLLLRALLPRGGAARATIMVAKPSSSIAAADWPRRERGRCQTQGQGEGQDQGQGSGGGHT